MKKLFGILAASGLLLSCSQQPTAPETKTTLAMSNTTSSITTFHDFKAETIDGGTFDFSSLKGKRVLIVNTASKCGYTGQYKDLQALYEKLGGEKFEIIGFPANDFMSQEPGSNEEIQNFCEKNYGVTFPMMAKISVKGKDTHPIYKWLTSKELNGISNASVKWNFTKFLVDENGTWVASFGSSTKPMDEEIVTFASWK
ncbi:MAG: glutathione peroxidase [Schleiferiaceae bacterium]|nr:glutathione peroxidase [Schleiferiaceae bacterium]